jgi:hypothetical protein
MTRKCGFRECEFLPQPHFVEPVGRLLESRRNELHDNPDYCGRVEAVGAQALPAVTEIAMTTGTEAEDFPEAVVDGVAEFLGKPRARGWIHVYSAFIAAVAGAALVSASWSAQSNRAGIATLIYTLTLVAMFAVSGAYHRVHWRSATAHKWMKRLDH